MRRAIRKTAKWAVILCGIAAVAVSLLALVVWSNAEERSLQSTALGEQRRITIYNAATDSAKPHAKVILALDGERMRHGLSTAMQARFWAFLRGTKAPVVVAIDGEGSRDTDLRNAQSQPAQWRPTISGRAEKFDRFLLDELVPQFQKSSSRTDIYLFGHSLAGLYTVDFAIRHHADRRFAGFAAFTPTISHDLSILERLPSLCAGTTPVLATIGWESDREHQLFDQARGALRRNPDCAQRVVTLEKHPGMIHQIVMLTGQAQAIRSIVLD